MAHENVDTDLGIVQSVSLGQALAGRGEEGGMKSFQLKGNPETPPNGDAVLIPDDAANAEVLEDLRDASPTSPGQKPRAGAVPCASDKKADANRRNALKSTGPRTPEGKAAVHLNALRHGLRSEQILLPGEDREDLRELDEHLRAELCPYGELERLFVDRIVAGYWRLRRLGRVEAGIFAWEHYEEIAERAEWEARSYEKKYFRRGMWDRDPEIEISEEKKHEEALSRARRIRSEQEDETTALGRTFARDADRANAFSKLSRYETSIEPQIYRALHELERRQAARAGAAVTPPQVVDVDV